jgi:hypothetical protein
LPAAIAPVSRWIDLLDSPLPTSGGGAKGARTGF